MSVSVRSTLGGAGFVAMLLAACWPAAAQSTSLKPVLECTAIVDAKGGAALYRQGSCDKRVSALSTFKVPLALIGYDTGILTDPHNPRWDYKPEFNAIKRDQRPVNPSIWLADSVVWYSQELTRKLGAARFGDYVRKFNYGNRDISGNPGKNDGLTQAWLNSSLKISPDEQIAFLRGIAGRSLPVSAKAYDMTEAAMPAFEAGGWQVKGKTGTGRLAGKGGAPNSSRPIGWFVGWAEKDGKRIVFAKLVINNGKSDGLMGRVVRAAFLEELPGLIK